MKAILRRKSSLLVIATILCLLVCGCDKKTTNEIKIEFENLNGKYRNVSLDEKNPFVIKSEDEVIDLISEGKTLLVFYGSKEDNYTRSVISIVSDISKLYGIKEVYYVERNSNIPMLSGYIDGLLSGTTTCISGYQTDTKMELTDEIINDSKEKITNIIKPISDKLNACDIDVGC